MLSSIKPESQTHIPVPRTRLVGRQRDIERVADLLRYEQTRLLTLCGPGGSGKTRLAIAVAAVLAHEFPAGVWFVPLAPVSDPAFVTRTIAATLQVVEQPDVPMVSRLEDVIGNKRMLLVLDNFEHVIDAATDVSHLVDACPRLKILATSRMRLRLYGEQEYAVVPLGLPSSGASLSAHTATASDAVELFIERARDVAPDFVLTDENAGVVVDICRQLDGLPLAIELAAARIRHLTLNAISQRIGEGLDVLRSDARDTPVRQHTLRSTIAWSYNLLSPDTQVAFRSLGVFRGGWSQAAAEQVAGDEITDVSSHLEQLIDHNLIRVAADREGNPRYTMLETIREYALEQLEAGGEAVVVRHRHASYFAGLVAEAGRHTHTSVEWQWMDRIDDEYDNIRAALAWFLETLDVERGLLTTGRLNGFWHNRRSYSEGCAYLKSFLDMPADGLPGEARAMALIGLVWLSVFRGDVATGMQAAEEAVSLAREANLAQLEPEALLVMGIAIALGDNIYRSAPVFREAIELSHQVGDLSTMAKAFNNLSICVEGDAALDLLEDGLRIARQIDDPATTALLLQTMSSARLTRFGYSAETLEMAQESLRIYHRVHNLWGMAMGLDNHALFARHQGDFLRATKIAAASDAIHQWLGMPRQSIAVAEYEELAAELHAVLGDEFNREWSAGAALTPDEAVQLALEPYSSPTLADATGSCLSPRELDVLRLLVDGRSNREIAGALFISPHTAAHHVTSILNKLGLESRTAAATWAVRHGVI